MTRWATPPGQLLRAIAGAIRARLRPYDVVVRYGGDEFLCGLLDLDKAAAAERFVLVKADLAATHQASVTTGLAEVEADDALEELILTRLSTENACGPRGRLALRGANTWCHFAVLLSGEAVASPRGLLCEVPQPPWMWRPSLTMTSLNCDAVAITSAMTLEILQRRQPQAQAVALTLAA